MKTTQKKMRFVLIAGLAALAGALAFNAALRFAADAPSSQTTPGGVSEDRDADLKRWTRLMRTQLELRGIQGKELEQLLKQRRSELAGMDPSDREEHVINSGFRTVKWNPEYSDQKNRIRQKLFELTGSTRYPSDPPSELIEMLAEGMDDLTAAQKLYTGFIGLSSFKYANIYVDRALAKDPDSRDALVLKARLAHNTRLSRKTGNERIYSRDAARRLVELYPDDQEAMRAALNALCYDYPEDAIELLEPLAPKDGAHWSREALGTAYERLDMIGMANYHYSRIEVGHHTGPYIVTPEGRSVPSIWEERAPDAAAMQTPSAPSAEMDMAAAYADFAKAYQSAFEMEYALSEATPEGYMNALLGMARAFARAGDAKRGQDAYNAVRKRHSREEVLQVFRQLDKQDWLRREASNEEYDDEDE